MVHTLTRTLQPNSALVLPQQNVRLLARHQLFRALPEEDRAYLSRVMPSIGAAGDRPRLLILPSERKVILAPKLRSGVTHLRAIQVAIRSLLMFARAERIPYLSLALADYRAERITPAELVTTVVTQTMLANYEFVRYRTAPEGGFFSVSEVALVVERPNPALRNALKIGRVIGEETNKARDLANTPGGEMTPRLLADAAKSAAQGLRIRVSVLDEAAITELGMGGILGVARGSAEPPRLIVLEYHGGAKKQRPVALVGKGVTFDTGGLNLKPEQGIADMHMDMAGGAAVIHAIAAAARLGAKRNIVGIIPAVENMPSGSSYRPGDLLRTMSGKTIEILNTDAEGRVIMADALTYAREFEPTTIIDVATLTGAAMAALGQRMSALFTTDARLVRSLTQAGERSGEHVWLMPLWEEYADDADEIKGTFGDVANLGRTKYGGAITGAMFLRQFAQPSGRNPVWAHIDIAPRMTAIEGEHLAKGATGVGVGILALAHGT
jgi:leucyl aminopeptidase